MKENNVIFEKNAIEKFCKEIKNFGKVFILTSPTPKQQFFPIISNLLNENCVTFWSYCLPKNAVCNTENVLKACSVVKNASVIVALGTGTVCDTAKLVSKKLNLPFVVVPTAITHFGIFNNVAYLKNAFVEVEKTDFPKKVYIDEAIINKSPTEFINSTLCFSIAQLEYVYCIETMQLTANENEINVVEIKNKIKKIEELCNWLSLSNSFAILNLMDYVFDLFELFNFEKSNNSIIFANFLNCSTLKRNFGEKTLLCSQILLKCYSNFLKQKLILPKNIPEREKILKILSKNQFSFEKNNNIEDFFNLYIQKTNYLLNQSLQLKLQFNRICLIEKCLEKQVFISKFLNKLFLSSQNNKQLRMIDETELFSTLEILPLFSNSFLPSLLSRFGYLNIV